MSDIGKRVGNRIRELRTRGTKPGTQGGLAKRARLSVSYLSMIERGERVPHLAKLEQLALALGVPLSAFFESPPDARPSGQDALLRPLLDFATSRRMSASDVDGLMRVARAILASREPT